MTVLDCSVTGCAHNENQCCSLTDIRVEGREAKVADGTYCGNFREKLSGEKTPEHTEAKKETSVCCDACNCSYNKDLDCTAEHIGIIGNNACNCRETECVSFAAEF